MCGYVIVDAVKQLWRPLYLEKQISRIRESKIV